MELAKIFANRVIDELNDSSGLRSRINLIWREKSSIFITSLRDTDITYWVAAWDNRREVEDRLNREFVDVRYYFKLHRSTVKVNGEKYYRYSLEIRWRKFLTCC